MASSWIPQGTHDVVIGPSLHKALKARRGGPPPPAKRSGPPDRDFYSFRYNFKPPSVDNTKPGTIEVSRGKDATTVTVEHPSSQPGEGHVYTGNETAAKELDCILIYDEETGSYRLEKLEAYVVLTYERKSTVSLPASSASSPAKADSEETRLSVEVDAEGEIDDELPQFQPPRKEEEEEEEGELEPVPLPPPPVKPSKPSVVAPSPRPEPTQPRPAAKPAPQRKQTKRIPPPPPPPPAEPDVGDAYEEDLEFGRPSVKRKRRTPPPPAAPPAQNISFPSSSTGWVPPPAPASASAKPPPAPAPGSDSEDDWEQVPTGPVAVTADAPIEIEIDMNDFEAELEAQLGDGDGDGYEDASEQEDFLANAMPNTTEATPARAPLPQLASYSDDEYSSSEDSDDD